MSLLLFWPLNPLLFQLFGGDYSSQRLSAALSGPAPTNPASTHVKCENESCLVSAGLDVSTPHRNGPTLLLFCYFGFLNIFLKVSFWNGWTFMALTSQNPLTVSPYINTVVQKLPSCRFNHWGRGCLYVRRKDMFRFRRRRLVVDLHWIWDKVQTDDWKQGCSRNLSTCFSIHGPRINS